MSTPDEPGDAADHASAEVRERQVARRRGRAEGGAAPGVTCANNVLASQAFVGLADNVRDYAVFLMEPSGVICYWGEGARLMKWWTRAQAEGSHLRFLYPSGGSEDGTAEAHLVEAAATGEYIGEGQRVRGDGSTFWAGVSLTALRDPQGTLIGFAKTTRDLTARRSAEAALALAWSARAARDTALAEAADARSARDVAEEDAAFALEQVRSAREYASQVLEREIMALQSERAELLEEMCIMNREIQALGSDLSVTRPEAGV